MYEKELKKFNLEESMAGGVLNHMDNLDLVLIPELDSNEKKDFLVHLKYSEKEQKYVFDIYKETITLKELIEDKGEKIGKPITVRAFGVGLEGRDGEMTKASRLRKAMKREAPNQARSYRIIDETNVEKNLYKNFSEFMVQYYL